MKKKFIVDLSDSELKYLIDIISTGKNSAKKILHSNILIKADLRNNWQDKEISKTFETTIGTVQRIRKRLVEEGLEEALNRKKHIRTRPRKFDGEQEAYLVAQACSPAPEGYSRWTLTLLQERIIELNIFESVSRETIRQTLKKMK
jgi:transposase